MHVAWILLRKYFFFLLHSLWRMSCCLNFFFFFLPLRRIWERESIFAFQEKLGLVNNISRARSLVWSQPGSRLDAIWIPPGSKCSLRKEAYRRFPSFHEVENPVFYTIYTNYTIAVQFSRFLFFTCQLVKTRHSPHRTPHNCLLNSVLLFCQPLPKSAPEE